LTGPDNRDIHASVPQDKSRLKQSILSLESERDRQLGFVLAERGPLIRGSLLKRRRVCGHPGCHCLTKGQLHVSPYLSVTVAGKTRPIHVPAADERHVKAASGRYRRFRRARRQLVRLSAQQLKLVDRLGDTLLEAYPAGQPVEPAGRRGPKPKKGRNEAR
jgi:uncharacterized protein YjiS (DUF1127 family)